MKYSKCQLFTSLLASPDQTNLRSHKILINELLHYISSNQIKNIQEELSYCILKENEIHNIIATSFNGKGAQIQQITEKGLLIITHWLIENLKIHFTTNILISFCEIQQILYLPDKNRSPLTILPLKVMSAFLLVCFVCLKEGTLETRKNVFYFTSKNIFILEIIKFQLFRH